MILFPIRARLLIRLCRTLPKMLLLLPGYVTYPSLFPSFSSFVTNELVRNGIPNSSNSFKLISSGSSALSSMYLSADTFLESLPYAATISGRFSFTASNSRPAALQKSTAALSGYSSFSGLSVLFVHRITLFPFCLSWISMFIR